MDPLPELEDDTSISDDEILYRRIAHYGLGDLVAVDAVTGLRRPSSGAFKSDDDGISIYLNGVLSEMGLGPDDLVRAPQNAVVAFGAAVPRQFPSASFVTYGQLAPTMMATEETLHTP